MTGTKPLQVHFAASQLTGEATSARKDMLELLKPSIALQNGCIDIVVGIQMLTAALGIAIDDCASRFVEMGCDAIRVRHGHEVRLMIADASNTVPSNCDTKLVALLAEAQAAAKLLTEHPGQSLSAIAKQQGRCRTRQLSCLAPDIITAIISGRQPVELYSKFLTATTIPMNWAGQRKSLGFPQTFKPQLQSEKVAVEIRL